MDSKINGNMTYIDYLRPALYTARYVFLFEILAVSMIIYIVLPGDTSVFMSSLIYLLGIVLISLILFMVLYIRVKVEYNKLDKSDHEKIVKISENGIEYGVGENLMFFQWEDIHKKIILKDHILLYITTRSALIIPKHFFYSIQEEKEWIKLLNDYLSN